MSAKNGTGNPNESGADSFEKLIYKTRDGGSPQGKRRVYFTCHPDDFDACFETTCEEIFQSQDCAIYYKEDPDADWDAEEMETSLGWMNLFVIPITSKFLCQDNPARETEFRFALEHTIPILPLMQESGLEAAFNRICGDLQFLDKNATEKDPTALPYEEKLENFLSSVLVGDELAAKVRDAFDAYIFMSYRKKDRKHAQELMHLIHKNEFCRDIAIWYDEFLVPGENFNQAIRDAMEKSDLFTFVVTPQLLEPDNYVMTIEYPEATSAEKPILPAEMEDTDREQLNEYFKNIPSPTNAHDNQALTDDLIEKISRLGLMENNDDPIHLFFIGLAYLNGIDMEVDYERAVHLITTAAEADLPEAMQKLSEMYENGEGVERDYEVSAQWLEELAQYREKRFDETDLEEDGQKYFAALWDLGLARYNMESFDLCHNIYQQMMSTAEQLLTQFGGEENQRFLADSYAKLCTLSRAKGNLSTAKIWCRKALTLYEEPWQGDVTVGGSFQIAWCYMNLAEFSRMEEHLTEARDCYMKALELCREKEFGIARHNLVRCCIGLGKISDEEDALPEARQWYQKALELSEKLCREERSLVSELSDSHDCLGQISMREEAFCEAKEWYQKAFEEREELFRKTETIESRKNLALSYEHLGDFSKEEEDFEKAEKWYQKALESIEELYYEKESIDLLWNLLLTYEKQGDFCQEKPNRSEAEGWYLEAKKLGEKMAGEIESPVIVHRELAVIYNKLCSLARLEGDLSKVKTWGEKCLALGEETCREAAIVNDRRSLVLSYCCMGDISREEEDFGKSEEWYRKGMVLAEGICRDTGTVEDRRDLSALYKSLAELKCEEKDLEKAKEWYEKDRGLCEELCNETNAEDAYDDLAHLYWNIGTLDDNDINEPMLEAAKELWKQLAQQYPEEPTYLQNAQFAHDYLKRRINKE